MATYGVAEITQAEGMMIVERRGDIDVDALSEQLMDIRNAISPILTEEPEPGGLALQSLEISLTVGVDRKIWFMVNGSAEASITLTFSRPSTS